MPKTPAAPLDFHSLGIRAVQCATEWRTWASQHNKERGQFARATRLASLFEEQSKILFAMHRNHIEVHPPTHNDFDRA